MESNGKGVSIDGISLPFEAGEIDFGEPGTNGQHSFYQLIHQGRVIPCDFIGVAKSQQPVYLKGEPVSNHHELMSNFFAQPDALAYGKTPDELLKENVAQHLIPHKTFTGNRPSLSLLLPSLDAYNIGRSLATRVRSQRAAHHANGAPIEGFNYSTTWLMGKYLERGSDVGSHSTTVLPQV